VLDLGRWGVALATTRPATQLLAVARRTELLGFDSFWLAEVYHWRSSIPLAAAIAGSTSRIRIGLGVIPVHTRHPALVTMEAVTLDELSAGRIVLGLGSSRRVAEEHGHAAGPVKAMSEALQTIRKLLDGETVTTDAADTAGIRLNLLPKRRIPLYVGTYSFSDQMLKVAGRHADGVIHIWTNPELTRHGREVMSEAAVAAGRDPESIIQGSFFVVSVDEDAKKARDAARPLIASYTRIVHRTWRRAGLVRDEDVDPVLAAFEARGAAGAAAVSDRLLEKVAIAGEPRYCLDRLGEYEGTGLTLPIAYGVLGPEPLEGLDLLARSLRARRSA